MKRACLTFCIMILFFLLTACDVVETQPLSTVQPTSQTATVPKQPVQTLPSEIPTTHPKYAPNSIPPKNSTQPFVPDKDTMSSIQVTVENKEFSATLEKNEATNLFVQLLQIGPIVIQMNDYSGFEKVGYLGSSLPESNSQIATQAGDIVLYNGNQICVFYGSNSWSYTKLGKIDDLSGWPQALGSGDITLTFSLD